MNRSSKPAFGTLLFFAIAFALSLYFAFAAIQGNYGLFRRAEIVAEAQDLRVQLAQVQIDVARMENLTHRLSDEYLDLDLLDEQTRKVLGMIRAFLEINTGNVEVVRQMKLAGGVAEALVTTASGLSIGIIAMIFYSVFRGRVQRSLSDLEAAATHLLALLGSQFQQSGRYQPENQTLPPDPGDGYKVPRSQRPAPSRASQADIPGA